MPLYQFHTRIKNIVRKNTLKQKLSYKQIADSLGLAKSTVYDALTRFMTLIEYPEETEAYVHYKSEMLNAAELKLLRYMTNDVVLSKASTNNLAYGFTQIFQANRLTQGQTTCNIAPSAIDRELAEIRKRRTDLQKQMDSTKAMNADYTILEEEKEYKGDTQKDGWLYFESTLTYVK